MKKSKENIVDKKFESQELNKLGDISKSLNQYKDRLETVNQKIKELEDFTLVFESMNSNFNDKINQYYERFGENFDLGKNDPLELYGKGKFGTEEEKQKIIEQRIIVADELNDARDKIKALQEDTNLLDLVNHVYILLDQLKKEKQEILVQVSKVKAISSDYDSSEIVDADKELIKKKLIALAEKKKAYQTTLISLNENVKSKKRAKIEANLETLQKQIDQLKNQLSPQVVEEILEGSSFEEGYDTNVGNEVDGEGNDYLSEMIDTLGLLSGKISDIAMNVQIKQNIALKMFNVLAVSYHKGRQKHKDKVKAYKDAKATNEAKTKATQDLVIGLIAGATITTGVGALAAPIGVLGTYAGDIIKDITVDTAKKIAEVTVVSILKGKEEKPVNPIDVAPQFMREKIQEIIYDQFNSILKALTEPSTKILQLRENLIELKEKEQWEMVPVMTKGKIAKLEKQVEKILADSKKEMQKIPSEEAPVELIKDTELTFWAAWIKTNENLVTNKDRAGSDKCEALRDTLYPELIKLGITKRKSLLKENLYELTGYYVIWNDIKSWANKYEPSLNTWKKGLGL